MKKLSTLGEWGLLDRLLPALRRANSSRVSVGPGDDAAVVRGGRGDWVVTTDMLVEGVHFDRAWTSGEDLGHKALAVNLSDLAAMGDVRPAFGVTALGLPPGAPASFVDGFYRGLSRLARRHGFDLVGGDTVRSPRIVVSIAAVGLAGPRGRLILRSGARPGDVLMATGALGDAAAGLAILQGAKKRAGRGSPRAAADRFLVRRLLRPAPRLDLAPKLAALGGVTALMDCSDGLWRSVKILCQASRVGARVDADHLPLSPALRAWAAREGRNPADIALVGGEDYELILTAKPEAARRIAARGWAEAVGRILPRPAGISATAAGKTRRVPHGFEHFG